MTPEKGFTEEKVSSSDGLERRPKLRFPGFEAPYYETKIGDVYAERNEKGAPTMELLSVTQKEGVIPRSELEEKNNASEDKSNYKIVHIGDMVYNSMRMWQGANGISPYCGIVSPAYTVLMPKEEIDNEYFASLFKNKKIINEFRKHSQGLTSDTWNLKYPQIAPIKIFVPTLREQHKISELLKQVQIRLEKQELVIETLKKYKRGLLSAIFERRIRFKADDGSDFPDWKKRRLGDLMDFKNGVNSSRDAFQQGGVKCIGVSDIYAGNPIYSHNIRGSVAISETQKAEYAVEYGDALFQRSSETQEDIGRAVIYMDNDKPAVFNGFVIRGKKRDEYNPLYLHYELQSDGVRKQTIRLGAGAQHYNIGQESLATISVDIPSLLEQGKIAGFLDSIDKKISVEESKLEAMKNTKHGLLQQLFI